jgi:hypothetical protein
MDHLSSEPSKTQASRPDSANARARGAGGRGGDRKSDLRPRRARFSTPRSESFGMIALITAMRIMSPPQPVRTAAALVQSTRKPPDAAPIGEAVRRTALRAARTVVSESADARSWSTVKESAEYGP